MIFKLPLPPSVNQYNRIALNGAPYTTSAARRWKDEAGWLVILQFKEQKGHMLTQDLRATMTFQQKGDLDNRIKPTLDLLQDCRVFQNDKQIVEIIARFGDVSGCEVEIETIG